MWVGEYVARFHRVWHVGWPRVRVRVGVGVRVRDGVIMARWLAFLLDSHGTAVPHDAHALCMLSVVVENRGSTPKPCRL